MSSNRIVVALNAALFLLLPAQPSQATPRTSGILRVAQAGGEPTPPGKSGEPKKPGAKNPGTKKPSKGKAGGEPTPKSSDEPTPKSSDEPTPKSSDEPGGKSPDEPGGKSPDEPGGKSPDEPGGKGAGEPGRRAGEPPAKVKPKGKTVSKFGVGFHIRATFLHPWTLGLFFDHSTPVNSMAFGGEFVYRRGSFDIIGSIDFGFYGPKDGNYLENGKNPTTEVDYIQFDGLNMLAFSVIFIKHHEILPWMSFVWGGGVGIGIVFGDMFRASAGPQGCDSETAGDETRCLVKGMDPSNPDKWLNDPANQGTEAQDNPGSPKRWKEDIWPVSPIVHLLVGLDFKISDMFSVRVDGGFRFPTFYVGATGHYFF